MPTETETETAVLTTFTRQLRCDLTQEEHVAKAEELAKAIEEEEAMLESHADKRKAMKRVEVLAHAAMLELREDVALGSEFRPTEVRWVAHYAEDIAKLVRPDTGEVLNVRPLEDHERQGVLPIRPPAKVEPAAEDDLPAEA